MEPKGLFSSPESKHIHIIKWIALQATSGLIQWPPDAISGKHRFLTGGVSYQAVPPVSDTLDTSDDIRYLSWAAKSGFTFPVTTVDSHNPVYI